MKKLSVAVLMFMSVAARADVDAFFATEVVNVRWGSTLQQIQAAHPGGAAWPNDGPLSSEGHVYDVAGEFRVLGLNFPAHTVDFCFSKDDKLDRAILHFRYADRDDVLYSLAEVLGQDYDVRDEKLTRVFRWKAGRQSAVKLSISTDPRLPWAYLSVYRRQVPHNPM